MIGFCIGILYCFDSCKSLSLATLFFAVIRLRGIFVRAGSLRRKNGCRLTQRCKSAEQCAHVERQRPERCQLTVAFAQSSLHTNSMPYCWNPGRWPRHPAGWGTRTCGKLLPRFQQRRGDECPGWSAISNACNGPIIINQLGVLMINCTVD